jgi:periplasmic protein TonB
MPEISFDGGPNAHFLAAGPHLRRSNRGRFGNALSVSALTHALAALSVLFVASRLSQPHDSVAKLLQDIPHIAWIAPGGGGSGKESPAPSRQLQRPGSDSVAIPVKARSEEQLIEQPTPPDALEIPVMSTAAGVQELPGVITAFAAISTAQTYGPGSGGGPGSGRGPGNGSGDGPGLGSGRNGGLGDGYAPGNGVSAPRLIREVKPGYTSEAMRARIQGLVRLQAIVAPDGSVSAARIVRSLDDKYGLDQEALKTVKQWRFTPGTLAGRAVPVVIEIELKFTLR